MSHFKFNSLIFILTIEQINIFCFDYIEQVIYRKDVFQDFDSSKTKKINYSFNSNEIESKRLLFLFCYSYNYLKPVFLYASFNENISFDNRMFSSQEIGRNQLYININENEIDKPLYILLYCPKNETKRISIYSSLHPRIELGIFGNTVKFNLYDTLTVYYIVPDNITHDTTLLYGIGEDWDFFEMKGQYKNSNGLIKQLDFRLLLETGHDAIVNLKDVGSEKKLI